MGNEVEQILNQLIESYARGPNAQLTLADLSGNPPHNRAEDQAVDLSWAVLNGIKETICKALLLT